MDLEGDGMSEYIKTIVSVVIAVSLLSTILPQNSFGKYGNLLTSIIIMAVLCSPFLNTRNNIKSDFLPTQLEFNKNSYIMQEFEKELAKKIEDELKSKTNLDFSATVRAEKNEDIIEIKEIEISPFSDEYVHIVSEYTGIGEERITQK